MVLGMLVKKSIIGRSTGGKWETPTGMTQTHWYLWVDEQQPLDHLYLQDFKMVFKLPRSFQSEQSVELHCLRWSGFNKAPGKEHLFVATLFCYQGRQKPKTIIATDLHSQIFYWKFHNLQWASAFMPKTIAFFSGSPVSYSTLVQQIVEQPGKNCLLLKYNIFLGLCWWCYHTELLCLHFGVSGTISVVLFNINSAPARHFLLHADVSVMYQCRKLFWQ